MTSSVLFESLTKFVYIVPAIIQTELSFAVIPGETV